MVTLPPNYLPHVELEAKSFLLLEEVRGLSGARVSSGVG
jgi:hypothetical protein